jgi:pyroglutamyl-peptidase
MEQEKLLITGFQPFGGDAVNPSWEAVKALPDTVGAYRLEKLLLPVEFGNAAELAIEAALVNRVDAILCVGLAASRTAVTPEAIGINVRDARIADNAGVQPQGEPIAPDGPAAYFSTLPVRKMTEAISAQGIPATLSYSAGTYVCNDLLYSMLHRFNGTKTRAAFIHVPMLSEAFPLPVLTRALSAAIESIEP